jgi:hypothetical protein
MTIPTNEEMEKFHIRKEYVGKEKYSGKPEFSINSE